MEINILIFKIDYLMLNPLINDYQNLKIKCFYEDEVNDVAITNEIGDRKKFFIRKRKIWRWRLEM